MLPGDPPLAAAEEVWMPGGRAARIALSILLLLVVTTTVSWSWDSEAVAAIWSGLFLASLLLVFGLLLGGVMLSSVRLKLITADLGYRLTLRDATMTLGVGQLAGTAFFQLAGQLIGRGAVLTRKGIPAAATVVISGYERAVALGVSLLLAATGALYLFGSLSIDLQSGGLSLIKLVGGLVAAVLSGSLFAWGGAASDFVRSLTPALLLRLLRTVLISLLIQGTTLASYVALEKALAPHIDVASLVAASCIIMLAASLPIGFGGWGLRELSAVVALQTVGFPGSSALVIALLIGVLSLAAIAGTVVTLILTQRSHTVAAVSPQLGSIPDYPAALDWVLPPLAATAIFFQVYLPTTRDGLISVNLADPVVLLGASLFLLHHFRKNWPVWRMPDTGTWIAAATLVVAFGIFRGWLSLGWTDWAFVNKGLGWPMLLCYGMTGALIVRRARQEGLDLLAATFAASAAGIVALEVILLTLYRLGLAQFAAPGGLRIDGFSQNPNAFALLLNFSLAAALMLHQRTGGRLALIATPLVGIWFSGSWAGLLAVPVVLGAALMMGVGPRTILRAIGIAAIVVTVVTVLPLLQSGGSSVLEAHRRTDANLLLHLQSILDGLSLFLSHPLFGAGIGAYIADQIRTTGVPLVIHSTPVWLLAETGPIGLGVFIAAAWRLFSHAVRHRGESAALLLLLILCGLAVMSAAHELLYQRAFWLLLGAVLAMPVDGRHDHSS